MRGVVTLGITKHGTTMCGATQDMDSMLRLLSKDRQLTGFAY